LRLSRSLCRVGHDAIGLVKRRFRLRDVIADACQHLHHRRLLIARQADQFAAGVDRGFALLLLHLERYRIDRRRNGCAVSIDNRL